MWLITKVECFSFSNKHGISKPLVYHNHNSSSAALMNPTLWTDNILFFSQYNQRWTEPVKRHILPGESYSYAFVYEKLRSQLTCSPRGCEQPSSAVAPDTGSPSRASRWPGPSPHWGRCLASAPTARPRWSAHPAAAGTGAPGSCAHSWIWRMTVAWHPGSREKRGASREKIILIHGNKYKENFQLVGINTSW